MKFVPGRILVGFYDHIGSDHAAEVIAALGVDTSEEITGDDGGLSVHILTLPAEANVAGVIQAFRARPEVEFADLDRIVEPALLPDDPRFNLDGTGNSYGIVNIRAFEAWDITTGSADVVIAIIDTGVDGTHEDLVDKMVAGRNIYGNNSDTSDQIGHGTAVASLAGASSNNAIGVVSVAWQCKLMPVKVSQADGNAPISTIAQGLTWAADNGAKVANISFGGLSNDKTIDRAAKYFRDKGGVVCVCAGNQGSFQSANDDTNMLTIGAVDRDDLRKSYSNYGNNLDLMAPGDATVCLPGNQYGGAGGTSIASPYVAGVAALIFSVNPSLTPAQVEDILKNTADDLGAAGWDIQFGYGRLNAFRAVTAATGITSPDTTPPTVAFTSPANGATVSGTVPLNVTAADDVGVASVVFKLDGVTLNTDSSAPFSYSWDSTGATNATHTLTATATDAAGNSATATISVIVNNVADGGSPPTVSITSPANLATVTGTVSVTVSVSGNVVAVELYVDGVLKATSKRAPFTTKWNTRNVASGTHTLQCKAYTATNVQGSSAIINVSKA